MKLVRRARKSIRERRMKACINDLSSNLVKVEKRVFAVQKEERARARRVSSSAVSGIEIPKDIKRGVMNLELYEVECRLHKEAGLPPPRPYPRYFLDKMRQRRQEQRIGFVSFSSIINTIRKLNTS